MVGNAFRYRENSFMTTSVPSSLNVFLVFILDYRLVFKIAYPNPAEDSAAALKWIVENLGDSGIQRVCS